MEHPGGGALLLYAGCSRGLWWGRRNAVASLHAQIKNDDRFRTWRKRTWAVKGQVLQVLQGCRRRARAIRL